MRKSLFRIVQPLLALLLAAAGLVTVQVATAGPAAAHGNACTGAPDRGVNYDFHQACHNHDSCYFHKPHGPDDWGRIVCDSNFYVDTHDSCDRLNARSSPELQDCYRVAKLYFGIVSRTGPFFFKKAGPGTYPFHHDGAKASAKRYSSSAGEVFWPRATDPDGYVKAYQIFRNGSLIAVKDATSLWQPGLSAGTYHYTIYAIDNDGKRSRPIYTTLRI